MENIHIDHYEVTSYHADFAQKLAPIFLFCFLQESAGKHAQSKGFGWHDLALKQEFWVLAKVHAIIHRMPQWGEEIRLETWGKQPELLTAYRDFELFDSSNSSVISATSSWHILNMNDHKAISMNDFVEKFSIISNKHAIKQKPEKIRLPDSTPAIGKLFPVKPSDIDMNQHVNNTRYVQWAMDCIPFEFQQNHILSEISINFVSESRIHDKCYIETYIEKETVFLQAIIREEDNKTLSLIKSCWTAIEKEN